MNIVEGELQICDRALFEIVVERLEWIGAAGASVMFYNEFQARPSGDHADRADDFLPEDRILRAAEEEYDVERIVRAEAVGRHEVVQDAQPLIVVARRAEDRDA